MKAVLCMKTNPLAKISLKDNTIPLYCHVKHAIISYSCFRILFSTSTGLYTTQENK